jgi:hypothetical protein
MSPEAVAIVARDTCLESLRNPHKTHTEVADDVYHAILRVLPSDRDHCEAECREHGGGA